jgi:hypothetical protein
LRDLAARTSRTAAHCFIASDHMGTDTKSHFGFLCLNSFTPASETLVSATLRCASPVIAESSINPVSEILVFMRSRLMRFFKDPVAWFEIFNGSIAAWSD